MYSYIKGELVERGEEKIVVENHGIGYNIRIPMPAVESFFEIGEQVKIYTYLHVREDAMQLFGFLSKDDVELFKMLIGVSGIGPKGALSILSTMTTDELRFAVLGEDAKAISKAPGIGGKTAQRLILELKDKFNLEETFEHSLGKKEAAQMVTGAAANVKNETVMALTALGFSASEAMSALKQIPIKEDSDTEEILKEALKILYM